MTTKVDGSLMNNKFYIGLNGTGTTYYRKMIVLCR